MKSKTLFNKKYPFQVWCCNQELYEQGEDMGLSKAFAASKPAVKFYEEQIVLCCGKVAFEFRHYKNPNDYVTY